MIFLKFIKFYLVKLARDTSYDFGLHLAGSQTLRYYESHNSLEPPIFSFIVCRRETHSTLQSQCYYFVFSVTHSQKKKKSYNTFDYCDWKIKDKGRHINIGKITKQSPSLLNKSSFEMGCNMDRRKNLSHQGCY